MNIVKDKQLYNHNSSIRCIDQLYKLVLGNLYLKNKILYELKLYNIFSYSRVFSNIQSLEDFEFKEYLRDVNLNIGDECNLKSLLDSTNIVKISLTNKKSIIKSSIPVQIKTLRLYSNFDILSIFSGSGSGVGSLVLGLKTLVIKYEVGYPELLESLLPSTITKLKLFTYPYQIKLNTLPKSLIKFQLSSTCKEPIERGSLPPSLTSFWSDKWFSLPLESIYLPNGLINLTLGYIVDQFSSVPVEYTLPDSLTSLKFKISEGGINSIKLPNKLKELELQLSNSGKVKSDDCYTSIEGIQFPKSLEKLIIKSKYQLILNSSSSISGNSNQPIRPTLLPSNLKQLECKLIDFTTSSNERLLPDSLERLDILSIKDIQLKSNSLPSKLKSLCFSFNYFDNYVFNNGGHSLVESNILPSSLTFIDFGPTFNVSIGIGVLPAGLKNIVLGLAFDQPIIKESIPFGLEVLEFKNLNYSHYPIQVSNAVSTIIIAQNYYKQFESNPQDMYSLKIPYGYYDFLLHLNLSNKINLQYLDLDNGEFSKRILSDELPSPINNIKTLIVGHVFTNVINLELFQSLETIIINGLTYPISIITTTTTTANENSSSGSNKDNDRVDDEGPDDETQSTCSSCGDNQENSIDQDDEDLIYNFYSLKCIQVQHNNTSFLDSLDPIFYQFIKLKHQ